MAKKESFETNILKKAEDNQAIPENGPPKDKRKKKKWFAIIPIIILIIILLLLRSCGANKGKPQTDDTRPSFNLTQDENAEEGKLEGKSKEEIELELNEKIAEGMINMSMNLNPIFEDGTSEGNLLIFNEDVNKHPQVIEIYNAANDELLYRSGGIPVGHRVDTGTLLVDLEAGTYECIAYFNAVNEETNELAGKAAAEIVITVKN